MNSTIVLLLLLAFFGSCFAKISPIVDSNLFDLSWAYNNKSMQWVEFRSFEKIIRINEYRTYATERVWILAEDINMAIHSGTHMDAPAHFVEHGMTVDEIPLAHFVDRPLVVIDIVKQAEQDRDYMVSVEDVQNWETEHGEIPDGAVILIRTGYSKYYGDRKNYLGTETNDHKLLHFPGVGGEAAKWIVDNRKVVGIGIEGMSLDCGQASDFPAHRTVLGEDIYILENVGANIHNVPKSGARVNVYPMTIEGGSGAPSRIIVNTSPHNASFAVKPQSMATLLAIVAVLFALFQR